MKKDFKYYVIFVFMLLILGTTNVYAVSSMKVTEKSYIKTNFSDGTHRTEAYFNTNKGVAYCITPSKTGATLMYDPYVKEKIMAFLTDLTSEYRRVYETGARYPDVTLAILQQSFSFALYDNRKEVNIFDVKKAILNTKNVYQDVIKKEIPRFEKEFKQEIEDGLDRGLSNDK